jgi:hypothetical protein
VIVPLYAPDRAPLGTVTMIVGLQLADVVPTPPVEENAVRVESRVTAPTDVSWPGMRTMVPLDPVAGPDQ